MFVSEEYGYRYWLWHTGMTKDELVAWWTQLETVGPYFYTCEGLPGDVVLLEGTDTIIDARKGMDELGYWSAHIHTDEDSSLGDPDGNVYNHRGYDPL